MKLFIKAPGLFLILFFLMLSCRKVYDPPAIKASNHFFAVDGLIQTGIHVSSTFTLSRSLNLADTVPNIRELNAQVTIVSSSGNSFQLFDTAGNGVYVSAPMTLDSTLKYQLSVTAADGNKYVSDFVTPESSPPIDSVTWELENDPATLQQAVNLYMNAHDPKNNTHYYRWDFLQTYKHISFYETPYEEANGLIYDIDPNLMGYSIHSCWSTVLSSNIMLGTTITLGRDVVSHIQIGSFTQNDPKLDIGSSFLVRQYPLSLEAYNYWLNVQKNSQSLGGLFDLQPAQLAGNMHCISNPNNPALGYVSASSLQSARIYISNKSLPGWQSNIGISCPQYSVLQDQLNLLIWNYPDTSFGPYHFAGDLIIYLVVAPKYCLDCRYQGGINEKPAFWPQYD